MEDSCLEDPCLEDRAWRPVASQEVLIQRANLMNQIRAFFWQRGILEVETPQLLSHVAPELHQDPIACQERFLQTSPETAMKRLLAAGMGPIYQICHAFRDGEWGTLHNPEFTMLEWYRPGWSYRALMAEVEALLWEVLGTTRPAGEQARVLTFGAAFQQFAGVDPFSAHSPEWAETLDRLLVQQVEPGLKAMGGAVFLVDFPPFAAAMAQVDPGPPAAAMRFELYLDGVELANGYQELIHAKEQRQRLLHTNQQRQSMKKKTLPIDEKFLQALASGLPECSGVALGLDRLIMLALGAKNIQAVMAFPFNQI